MLGTALATCAAQSIPNAQSTPNATTGTSATANAATSTTAIVTRTLRGQVTNALTGAAVPRVMVTINNRMLLTDSQGNFEFREFTDASATVKLTKPGYSQARDNPANSNGSQRLIDLDAFAGLKIYPDAVITGIVTNRDGAPLAHVAVTLRRQVYQATGGLRWIPTHSVQTDLQGEYRFLEPAGRFQVSLNYVANLRETAELLVPSVYPQPSGSDGLDYFEVKPGQEQHIDLRARTSQPYPVTVHIDNQEAQRGVQIYAVTSAGDTIPNLAAKSSGQGDFQVNLPAGTFVLHAAVNSRDTQLEGSTRVTVSNTRTEPVTIHIEPAASLPVELAIDPASSASGPAMATSTAQSIQPPNLQQFNLRLHSLASGSTLAGSPEIVLHQRNDKTFEFQVPQGRYRLESYGSPGSWYIESASYGTSNLMTSEIVVGSGGSGIPVRVVVNNNFGTVTGTVVLPAYVPMAWVYLVPTLPSLAPINPVRLTNSMPGVATMPFSMKVPAGAYLAVAFDQQAQEDLRSAEVIARLSTEAKAVTVSGSGTATVDLAVTEQKASAP